MNFSSIKKSILTLMSSALGNEIVSQTVAGLGVGTLATTNSASPLMLLVLTVVFSFYKFGENKQENKEEAKKVNDLFDRLKKSFALKLDSIRSTEFTLLEKEINNSLSIDNIKELQEFIIHILENQEMSIEYISKELSYTHDELTRLCKNIDNINIFISHLESQMSKEHCEQNMKLDMMNNKLDQFIKLNLSNNNFNIHPIVTAVINTGTIKINIVTGVDSSLDNSIKLIWDDIVKGDCNLALEKLQVLVSDIGYKNNSIVDVWNFALRAKINYMLGFIDIANEAAEKAISLQSSLELESNPILNIIFARYYIDKKDNAKARALLTDIINLSSPIALEALALSIHISDDKANEIEDSLTLEQRNHYLVLEALSCKYYKNNEFFKAQELAWKSFKEAKKVNAFPCYSILISALLGYKMQSKEITIGFVRPFINKKDWSEFHEINEICIEFLNVIKKMNNDIALSIIYYNLAMIHFICNDIDTFDYYTQNLFSLKIIAESVIEPCAAMWIKFGCVEKAINELRKIKTNFSSNLLFYYATVLFQYGHNDDLFEGINILNELISDKNSSKELRVFSALLLGCHYIDNDNTEKYNEVKNILISSVDLVFALRTLEAYENKDIAPEHSIKTIKECIKDIPLDTLRYGNFISIILPILKSLRQWKIILDIIEPFVPRDAITSLGNNYFNFAVWGKEYDRVEKYCRGLRKAKCFNFELLQNEIIFVCSSSYQNAEKLVNEILEEDIEESLRKKINVWRDIIRHKLGFLKENLSATEDYIAITDIDVNESFFPWCNIPLLLKECGCYEEAINYGYELLLRFPNESQLRKIYMGILLLDNKGTLLDNYEVVESNVAVTLECIVSNQKKIVILDNSTFAREDKDEYSSESSWGKLLMGKKLGETIVVSPMGLTEWKIKKIENKFIFRLHNIMEQESQSPNASMQQIYLPTDSNGSIDFTEMLKATQHLHEEKLNSINRARHFFMENSSLYIFAKTSLLGIDKTLRYFASQTELFIFSSQGDYLERKNICNLLSSNKKILLTPMTIELLLLFEASSNISVTDILRNSGLHFCICEYISEDYRQELSFPFSSEMLGVQDGMLNVSEDILSAKRRTALLKMMEYFNEIDVISGNCEREDFQRRENNFKWIWGRPLYQSLYSASIKQDFIIWEDDINSIKICNELYEEIDVKERVFTQAMFMYLEDNDFITQYQKVQMSIFLLAINERFTSFDANTIIEIFSDSNKYGALKEKILRYIEHEKLDISSLLNVTLNATILWGTEYKDRQNAKESMKYWFDNLSSQYEALARTALTEGLKAAYKKNRKKATPILRFAVTNLAKIIDLTDVEISRQIGTIMPKRKIKRK